jgi:hypothetical protein
VGLAALLALAVAVTALALSGSTNKRADTGRAAPPGKLIATVTASGQVTVTTPSGGAVTQIRSGRYTVLVRVNSPEAGFRLSGPGVQHATSTHFTGLAVWGVRFVKGTYHYASDRGAGAHAMAHLISVH